MRRYPVPQEIWGLNRKRKGRDRSRPFQISSKACPLTRPALLPAVRNAGSSPTSGCGALAGSPPSVPLPRERRRGRRSRRRGASPSAAGSVAALGLRLRFGRLGLGGIGLRLLLRHSAAAAAADCRNCCRHPNCCCCCGGWRGSGEANRSFIGGEIVVEIVLFGRLAADLGLLRLLGRGDDAEIVLGVLEIVLGHDAVAGGLRIAGELQVLLGDMGGVAAHLHVGAVTLVVATQRVAVLAAAIVVAPTRAVLVVVLLVWSHRLFSSLGKEH